MYVIVYLRLFLVVGFSVFLESICRFLLIFILFEKVQLIRLSFRFEIKVNLSSSALRLMLCENDRHFYFFTYLL